MAEPERLHALDAVRAFALLLGVVLHATMSFLPELAANGWPLVDNSPSDALTALFLWIHIFRMSLFFLLAGFFARLLYLRRGAAGFWRNRLARILAPLVLGWLAFVPLSIHILNRWAASHGREPFHQYVPDDAVLLFPLNHLWFLYLLLILYALLFAARWLITRVLDRQGRLLPLLDVLVRTAAATPLGALLIALPLAVDLATYAPWWPALGIPTPDYSLVPHRAALVAYGLALAFGWALHRQAALLDLLARRWPLHLGAACVLTLVCAVTADVALGARIDGEARRMAYALCYCAAMWCWVFGITGAALRYLAAPSRVARYLADASYWVYLSHPPLVFALQAWVADEALPWGAKFALVLLGALALALLAYQLLVRGGVVGVLLNGRRYA